MGSGKRILLICVVAAPSGRAMDPNCLDGSTQAAQRANQPRLTRANLMDIARNRPQDLRGQRAFVLESSFREAALNNGKYVEVELTGSYSPNADPNLETIGIIDPTTGEERPFKFGAFSSQDRSDRLVDLTPTRRIAPPPKPVAAPIPTTDPAWKTANITARRPAVGRTPEYGVFSGDLPFLGRRRPFVARGDDQAQRDSVRVGDIIYLQSAHYRNGATFRDPDHGSNIYLPLRVEGVVIGDSKGVRVVISDPRTGKIMPTPVAPDEVAHGNVGLSTLDSRMADKGPDEIPVNELPSVYQAFNALSSSPRFRDIPSSEQHNFFRYLSAQWAARNDKAARNFLSKLHAPTQTYFNQKMGDWWEDTINHQREIITQFEDAYGARNLEDLLRDSP